MSLHILREVISDPTRLSVGYQIYDGFVFKAIRHPANVFDAIVIRNPATARRFGDTGVESCRSLEEHIDWINRNKWDKALVIAEDISFLIHCPTLKHIDIIPSVTAGDHFDFSPLYRLPQILSLWCATNYGKFDRQHSKMDYSRVRGLEDLSVGTEYDVNYHMIPTLRKLSATQYPGADLRELFCSRELDTLEMISSKIRTLDGIEAAPKMQCLYLEYNRLLSDISKLSEIRETLRALRIRKCPKNCDFSVLSQLENLEYLFLEGSNKIPSLDFISSLPKLKTLILNMEVEDGDLRPCLRLSYAHCGTIRRHYNTKASELPKGKYYRGNENIEPWRRVQ